MGTRDGLLIASAVMLVGGAWLYMAEVRPVRLREECTAYMLTENELRQENPDWKKAGEFNPEHWTKMCVEAGGRDAFVRAIEKGNELRGKVVAPD